MTARDFQDEAKKEGAPWFLAKSFDSSCPVSDFVPKEKVADPHKLRLWCNINGVEKQNATTDNMIFDIPTLLEYITQYVTLEPGDMVLTGTPAGVARVQSGDLIECGFDDIVSMSFKVQ
uniref:oxaloacetate tautomerase n=1 Tax=Plectus sambesii TaxID=2011161 RepID=A0A914UZ67_9BILA